MQISIKNQVPLHHHSVNIISIDCICQCIIQHTSMAKLFWFVCTFYGIYTEKWKQTVAEQQQQQENNSSTRYLLGQCLRCYHLDKVRPGSQDGWRTAKGGCRPSDHANPLSPTPTIVIYYYSALKLMLILPSDSREWKAESISALQ